MWWLILHRTLGQSVNITLWAHLACCRTSEFDIWSYHLIFVILISAAKMKTVKFFFSCPEYYSLTDSILMSWILFTYRFNSHVLKIVHLQIQFPCLEYCSHFRFIKVNAEHTSLLFHAIFLSLLNVFNFLICVMLPLHKDKVVVTVDLRQLNLSSNSSEFPFSLILDAWLYLQMNHHLLDIYH